MGLFQIFSGLILLLIILGGLLFLAAQLVIQKLGKKASKQRRRLWVWRSFLMVLIIYMVFLVIANQELLRVLFPGGLQIVLAVFLTVFFVAMIEITIIDLLLPDIFPMWKRITIEVFGFILICVVSLYVFNAGLEFLVFLP